MKIYFEKPLEEHILKFIIIIIIIVITIIIVVITITGKFSRDTRYYADLWGIGKVFCDVALTWDRTATNSSYYLPQKYSPGTKS